MSDSRELMRKYLDILTESEQPSADVLGSSPDYQNYKTRNITTNQNTINNASRNTSQNAVLTAHTKHFSPIYATQPEWDNWVRMGGIEYARQMDLDRLTDPRANQLNKDSSDQQNYVRSQLDKNTNEEYELDDPDNSESPESQMDATNQQNSRYDPNNPESWMDATNQQNAQFAQTHYDQPADDTLRTDGTFSDNMAYQNHAARTKTAQNNRVNFAKGNAQYKADLSANSQHTAPVYSSPEEWNQWVKQGGLDYAQQRDIDSLKRQKSIKFGVDSAEQSAYVDALNNRRKQSYVRRTK